MSAQPDVLSPTGSAALPDVIVQAWLADLLADRVRAVTARAGTGPAETTVLVLLRSVRLADLVHGARQFAAALEPAPADAWLRSWTRTRFLFGDPANLPAAQPARVVAPGGTAGWLGPVPHLHQPGLSRLLKPVTGRLPELPAEVDLPGTGDLPGEHGQQTELPAPRRVLQVAVAGLSLSEYLVHLHHTLAEAVLLGSLDSDEPVRISHRPAIAADPALGPPGYARVLPDPAAGGRLRLHTWLSAR